MMKNITRVFKNLVCCCCFFLLEPLLPPPPPPLLLPIMTTLPTIGFNPPGH
jgi:hypothetical protein